METHRDDLFIAASLLLIGQQGNYGEDWHTW